MAVKMAARTRTDGFVDPCIRSKRLNAAHRSGPSRDWTKVKNPDSPAMRRARAGLW
jgi:hypothetical protein